MALKRKTKLNIHSEPKFDLIIICVSIKHTYIFTELKKLHIQMLILVISGCGITDFFSYLCNFVF